ncbi:MAG: hypothetical protein KJ072_00340 [Verrucomicrobia bacterium]|nr:hypothetical protein [Verrucomicrobiota bacterium]
MNSPQFRLTFSLAAAILIPGLGLHSIHAQESLPEPARVFSSKTSLAVYFDLQRASQSGIWKALESRLGPLREQLSSLPQFQPQLAAPLTGMSGLQTEELAEFAIAIEGKNAFKNMETEQYDPDFSIVAAARFRETIDQEKLITQLLDEADKQKPGLRATLEQSRQRVGAVDWFDLPPEVFGDTKLPFALSLAVGPGQGGSMIGIGKSESLRGFVAGHSDGRLPAGIGAALAQRGQMWLYFPVPSAMIQEMSAGVTAGAGGAANNPMVAGLSKGLEKVREFGLGLSFGNNAVGVEVALGCVDAAAANDLQQGLQQFIGMMQMVAAQHATAPKLLTRLKTSASGTAFRLTTDVTVQDVEALMKSSGISPAPRARTTPGAGAPLPVPVAPVATEAPAQVEFLELLPGDEQQLRYTRLRIVNKSAEPVKEIRVTFNYQDRAGRPIGKWTRRHQDPISANLAPGNSTREIRCPTFHVPSTTARVAMTLHEVVFADGTKWMPAP